MWHELPPVDKRLSRRAVKLTGTPANANISQVFRQICFCRKPKTGNRNRPLMEIKALDFFIGLALGAALGIGGTILVSRVRGWLGHSEAGRLRAENRVLSRRLAEKDRHIGRMLSETERLAEKLGEEKT